MAELGFPFDPGAISLGNLGVALQFARAGVAVFPCDPRPKPDNPDSPTKRPLVSWTTEATTDEDRLASWWERWPNALVGLPAGPAGLVIIDADRHGGPDGVAAFEALAASHGLPAGPVVETLSGGRHYYFAMPAGERLGNSRGTLPAGVDVRGEGGFVASPGSEWRGRSYGSLPAILNAFEEGNFPVLPDWLAAMLRSRPETIANPASPLSFRERIEFRKRDCAPDDFFTAVKQMALQNIGAWVRNLFPRARPQSGTGAWRVSSKALGRDLQEDLSIAPNGIVDFGVADMGDARQGKRTAIDLVMEWGGAPDALAAARWLCEQMGVDPESLGAMPERVEWDGVVRNPQPKETIVVDGVTADAETGEVIEPAAPAGGDYAEAILARHGLVPDIARWILGASRVPQKRVAVAAALITVATAASRQMMTPTFSNLNLYLTIIGPTGSGKDIGIKAPCELLSKSGYVDCVGSEFASDVAYYDRLASTPVCLAPMDEFGVLLAAATSKGAPAHLQKTMAALRKFYDGGYMAPPHAVTRRSEPLFNPCLSIVGAATPQQFYSAMTGAQIEGGTLNRFVAVKIGPAERADPAYHVANVPQSLRDRLRELFERPGGLNKDRFRARMVDRDTELEASIIPWTDEAKAAWLAFEDAMLVRIRKDARLDYFAPRCALNALRVASVLAVSECVERPLIDIGHIELGKALVEASLHDMLTGYEEHAPETPENRLADRIMAAIAENGGTMLRSTLFKKLKKHIPNVKRMLEIIDLMIEAGEIEAGEIPSSEKGGRPAKAFRLRR